MFIPISTSVSISTSISLSNLAPDPPCHSLLILSTPTQVSRSGRNMQMKPGRSFLPRYDSRIRFETTIKCLHSPHVSPLQSLQKAHGSVSCSALTAAAAFAAQATAKTRALPKSSKKLRPESVFFGGFLGF